MNPDQLRALAREAAAALVYARPWAESREIADAVLAALGYVRKEPGHGR